MVKKFVNVGPRMGGELFDPPYRGFIMFESTGKKAVGTIKLPLYYRGIEVGYVIFRWREMEEHTHGRLRYQKAKGELDDFSINEHFMDTEILEMIRQAMETASWKFYIYQPENDLFWEEEQFERWVQHYLQN